MAGLSSGKIDKYDWGRNITFWTKQSYKQARIAYSPLGKALAKQTKATENKGEKQNRSAWRTSRKTISCTYWDRYFWKKW